jgi:hypothetical protein
MVGPTQDWWCVHMAFKGAYIKYVENSCSCK